tara:strand:+ start:737 stop:886 length:150 start_codon:yes stop_codon:yes gene_type:complete
VGFGAAALKMSVAKFGANGCSPINKLYYFKRVYSVELPGRTEAGWMALL